MHEIITSTKNDTVKSARKLQMKKGRAQAGTMLVEGEKCVYELMVHRPGDLRTLFICGERFDDTAAAAEDLGARIVRVAEHVMSAICECKTPQGIAAEAAIPAYECTDGGMVVALDDVQDPSNLGTIVRTADAAGASCVVLSQGCADAFAPKAVRASMGSIFHLPVVSANLPIYISELRNKGYEIAAAHIDGNTQYELDWRKTCLVIGNESRGISDTVADMATQRIKIPMFGKAESLNAAVAAGILIYKIRT